MHQPQHRFFNVFFRPVPSIPVNQNILNAAINALKRDYNLATPTPCIYCCACFQPNTDHLFDACPILSNHKLLKSHYISFVQFLQQTINDQQNAEASLNLISATETQHQETAVSVILQFFQDTSKNTTINDPDFHLVRE